MNPGKLEFKCQRTDIVIYILYPTKITIFSRSLNSCYFIDREFLFLIFSIVPHIFFLFFFFFFLRVHVLWVYFLLSYFCKLLQCLEKKKRIEKQTKLKKKKKKKKRNEKKKKKNENSQSFISICWCC